MSSRSRRVVILNDVKVPAYMLRVTHTLSRDHHILCEVPRDDGACWFGRDKPSRLAFH